MEIEGRNAFVTGGASGIGLALARGFAMAGANVTVADINEARLDEAVAQLRALGVAAHAVQLDVTDREAFARAADEAEAALGPTHILCANAGVGLFGAVKTTSYADWDWGLGVNLGGTVNAVQTFLPRILAHGQGGHIMATASAAGLVASPMVGVYVAAKMAVVGLMEVLRAELAEDGIGVSVLCPHLVKTHIYEHADARPERFRDPASEPLSADLVAQMRAMNDCGMSADDVAAQVVDAVRANRLYVITHPELRDSIRERYEAMLASVATGEVDPARLEAERAVLSFAPYREIIDAQAGAGEAR